MQQNEYPAYECTWYAAHEWKRRFNSDVLFFPHPNGPRHAKLWPDFAKKAGIPTSKTPRVGSVAVFPVGPYGHVAIVERVNSDGSIDVSEYNYAAVHTYGERKRVSTVGVQCYIDAPKVSNPEFDAAWKRMLAMKVYTEFTKPEDTVTFDRLAVVLSRLADALHREPVTALE